MLCRPQECLMNNLTQHLTNTIKMSRTWNTVIIRKWLHFLNSTTFYFSINFLCFTFFVAVAETETLRIPIIRPRIRILSSSSWSAFVLVMIFDQSDLPRFLDWPITNNLFKGKNKYTKQLNKPSFSFAWQGSCWRNISRLQDEISSLLFN